MDDVVLLASLSQDLQSALGRFAAKIKIKNPGRLQRSLGVFAKTAAPTLTPDKLQKKQASARNTQHGS